MKTFELSLNELINTVIKTGPYAHMTYRDKFWKFVKIGEPSVCWEFKGKLFSNGYGDFRMNAVSTMAHRVSYFIANGELPDDLVVCHHCDNRRCVNPQHLFIGTQVDNMQDMMQKGRNKPARGEKGGKSKLTDNDVRSIRQLAISGMFHREIAAKFGVSTKQITVIVNRIQWSHIE